MAADSADNKAQFIQPPNTLRTKVSVGGPRAVSPEALERAEKVIADLTDDYLKWVNDDLTKLQVAFDAMRKPDGRTKEALRALFEVAHDIKGQGGSFGYQLMTRIGGSLCSFLEGKEAINDEEIEAVQLHVDALKLVIAKNMKGEGGRAGDELVAGLQKVVQKLSA